jgi:hypothetical protein
VWTPACLRGLQSIRTDSTRPRRQKLRPHGQVVSMHKEPCIRTDTAIHTDGFLLSTGNFASARLRGRGWASGCRTWTFG